MRESYQYWYSILPILVREAPVGRLEKRKIELWPWTPGKFRFEGGGGSSTTGIHMASYGVPDIGTLGWLRGLGSETGYSGLAPLTTGSFAIGGEVHI